MQMIECFGERIMWAATIPGDTITAQGFEFFHAVKDTVVLHFF